MEVLGEKDLILEFTQNHSTSSSSSLHNHHNSYKEKRSRSNWDVERRNDSLVHEHNYSHRYRDAENQSNISGAGNKSGGKRLFVANLLYSITQDQLCQVFEAFGDVEKVQLPIDQETGKNKGFGFVQFVRIEDARAALILNGQLNIGGRMITVQCARNGDNDDDEGGDMSLNIQSRDLVMQKLDCNGTSLHGSPDAGTLPESPAVGFVPAFTLVVGQASLPAPLKGFPSPSVTYNVIGEPSESLMLTNMFDPKSKIEPYFYWKIEEEVRAECSMFGVIKHLYIDKDSAAGHVYLQFENTKAASDAQRALHGRWFAGKMITAIFMLPDDYEAKFPVSY